VPKKPTTRRNRAVDKFQAALDRAEDRAKAQWNREGKPDAARRSASLKKLDARVKKLAGQRDDAARLRNPAPKRKPAKKSKSNPSKIPAKVLAGHQRIWGGKIPAGALAELEKTYAREAATRKLRKGKKKNPAKSPAPKKRGPYKRSARARRPKGYRKNPETGAAETYRYFHGRDPEKYTDVETPVKYHGTLSGVGKLEKIRIKNGRFDVTLGFNGTLLAQNEKRTQLFIVGGDQGVKLEDFGIKVPHENELLGYWTDVWYHTVKDHLGDEGGDATYHHKFSKRSGGYPLIAYDVRNKLMHVVGGGYTLPAEGIDG
jgi:hypothetical protein